jgi:hypothetical protein
MTGDFNGDGKTDVACYTGASGVWAIALSTGSSLAVQNWSSSLAPAVPISNQCTTGDFNGDGLTDLICYGGDGDWYLGISTGNGFTPRSWPGGLAPATPITNQCTTGDFDGDGRTDLICYDGGDGGAWTVAFSTGDSFTAQTYTTGIAVASPITNQCMTGDFNGDGMTDLICYTGSGGVWVVGLSTGSGFIALGWSSNLAPAIPIRNQCTNGDFNGDGMTDLVCTGGAGDWYTSTSTGIAFAKTSWGNGSFAPGVPITNHCTSGDLNGDGMTDLICTGGGNGTWVVALAAHPPS